MGIDLRFDEADGLGYRNKLRADGRPRLKERFD
jgi:hypothetical protein